MIFIFLLYISQSFAAEDLDLNGHYVDLLKDFPSEVHFFKRGTNINGLRWDEKKLGIESDYINEKFIEFIAVRGIFKKPGWTLTHFGKKIKVDEDGNFETRFAVASPLNSGTLVAINDLGELERDERVIEIENFQGAQLKSREEYIKYSRKWNFTTGVGVSFIEYAQSERPDTNMTAITPKLAVRYTLGKQGFNLAGNIFYTAFALSSETKAPLSDTSLTFLGFNFRGAYTIPQVRFPWVLNLAIGVYYNKMSSNNGQIGYNQAYGPQIFPVLTYVMNSGRSAYFYFKLSPVYEGLDLKNAANRETAVGGGYTIPRNIFSNYGITFDFAQLAIKRSKVLYKSTSSTFGISYSF